MQRAADRSTAPKTGRSRRAAILVLMFLALPAVSAQSVSYSGWTWDGHELELVAADTLETPPLPDEWFARDKAMHIGASFLITLSSQYVFENKLSLSEGEALPLAMTSALSAGVLKEIMDSQRAHAPHFSQRDLVADAVGILLAAGLILL